MYKIITGFLMGIYLVVIKSIYFVVKENAVHIDFVMYLRVILVFAK